MAHVKLMGPLRVMAGGVEAVEIDARNVHGLLAALAARFPDLAPVLEDGVALAIDGEIFQDALLHPIEPDNEVHVLPMFAGG
jgi:sulfur-carrier protein